MQKLSRLTVLVMAVLALAMQGLVLAYSGGEGTAASPYEIATAGDLNTIGANAADWDKCFKLTADIDMSAYTGEQYNIIGTSSDFSFTGTFDGDGHVVSNLTYGTTGKVDSVGMFGYVDNATISNLGIENATISTAGENASCLVGYQVGGIITSCYSTGSVNTSSNTSYSDFYAGGLVGYLSGGTITNCYSSVYVTTYSNSTNCYSYAGGLVGYQSQGTISSCYSMGTVNSFISLSNNTCYLYAGGLVGYQSGGVTKSCYSIGLIKYRGMGKTYPGGLVGYSNGDVFNSFWDTQTSGIVSSAGGAGLTTAEMMQSNSFITWNTPSDTLWNIDEGNDYPRLIWQNIAGIPLSVATFNDFISGAGTGSKPYLISTAQQLNIIGLFPEQWNKVYFLENDIDLAADPVSQYNIIGSSSSAPFSGAFDGNGHVIRNLTTTSNMGYVGMFGYVNDAEISNLGIENVVVLTKGENAGGLVGYQNGGTIINSYSTGSVTSSSSSYYLHAGGLVGYQSGGAITSSYSNCSVSSSSTSSYSSSTSPSSSKAGGLVGCQIEGTITSCYSTGSVSSYSSSFSSYAGGLVGRQSGIITSCYSTGAVTSTTRRTFFSSPKAGGLVGVSAGTITSCYSTGTATASSDDSSYAGGLVGGQAQGAITNCYCTGRAKAETKGGFAGYINSDAVVSGSFWDVQASGLIDGTGDGMNAGIIGLDTADMQEQDTFAAAGWNFSGDDGDVVDWIMNSRNYPLLSWQVFLVCDGDKTLTVPVYSEANSLQLLVYGYNDQQSWMLSGFEDCSWITAVTPASGSTTGPADHTVVTVEIAENLAAGDYSCELILSSDKISAVSVMVSVHIYKPVEWRNLSCWLNTGWQMIVLIIPARWLIIILMVK